MRLNRKRRTAETTPTPSAVRELAYRVSDGIHVLLLWHPADDSVSLSVDDRRTGERFELPVPGDQALFAFNHPYAFAA
jgi:hypothetical protein